MNIKIIFKPTIHIFAHIGKYVFSSESPARIYRRIYGEDIRQDDYHLGGIIGDVLGTLIVLCTVIGAITGFVALFRSSETQPDELAGLNAAIECIKNSCDIDECISTYARQYPHNEHLNYLKRVGQKIMHDPTCNNDKQSALHGREDIEHKDTNVQDTNQKIEQNAQQLGKGSSPVTAESTQKMEAIEKTAAVWRSRTGPIYSNLKAFISTVSDHDQQEFTRHPDTKIAWDYLQHIQSVIQQERFGLTQENRESLSIHVNVTGINDIGDRAARALSDWLETHGFNTDSTNPDIYVDVKGSQSSNPDPYRVHIATTSLDIVARWLDGSALFTLPVSPPAKSGGSRDSAEDRSFSDAVAKMISGFEEQVHK